MTHPHPDAVRRTRALLIAALVGIILGAILWTIFLAGIVALVWQQVIA